MNKDAYVKSLKIASVFIGTVIGAGFASGKELMEFFIRFGNKGIIGLCISGILFMMTAWAILHIAYEMKFKSYREFTTHFLGSSIGFVLELIVTLFMYACLCAMIAGSGALLKQYFHIPYSVGAILMCILCFITLQFSIKGILFVNTLLVPILFIGAFVLGFHVLITSRVDVALSLPSVLKNIQDNFIVMAILYVSYNMITTTVVLSEMGEEMTHRRMSRAAGIIGGGALLILGLCLGVATLTNYGKIINIEIPLLEIVMSYNGVIQKLYLIVLLAAMYTTAMANGYGVVSRYETRSPVKRLLFQVLVLVSALVVASMGFSNFIKTVYPLFGYLGLFQVIVILLVFVTMKRKEFKNRRW